MQIIYDLHFIKLFLNNHQVVILNRFINFSQFKQIALITIITTTIIITITATIIKIYFLKVPT